MQNDIQSRLFKIVKDQLGGNDSIGNALSDILNLSPDAVYRRFRGETLLTINEVKALCKHFDISFDALMNLNQGNVMFSYSPMNSYDFSLETYLENILHSMKKLHNCPDTVLTMTVDNTHFFQIFNFPQLMRFRLFFWAKTHLQIKEYRDQKFRHEKTTERAFELGQEILTLYNKVKSVEIIDASIMEGFMRQIYYYFESRLFEDPEYAVFLCDRVQMFFDHLQKQAIAGKKYIYGTEPPATGNELQLYLNETNNVDSTFLYESSVGNGVYLPHHILNYLYTSDPEYVKDTRKIMNKQLENTCLISVTNEKERNILFEETRNMVAAYKNRIEFKLKHP